MTYRVCAPLQSAQTVHVIGDIHGHDDALAQLLAQLGLADEGQWPRGDLVVFVGDLTDRGPKSPQVLQRVQRLMEAGHAQCVLGNHDLKLLTQSQPNQSAGNHWFWGRQTPGYGPQNCFESEQQRDQAIAFLEGLPLALESSLLRVVHAAWDRRDLERLQAMNPAQASAVWRSSKASIPKLKKPPELDAFMEAQIRAPAGQKPAADPERDGILAHYELNKDNHPAGRIVNGPESQANDWHWGGKWRLARRSAWWQSYPAGDPPIVFGHYWRRRTDSEPKSSAIVDLFHKQAPNAWLGPGSNCFCVDYSMGKQSIEESQASQFSHGLAALSLKLQDPSQQARLTFHDGESHLLPSPWSSKA